MGVSLEQGLFTAEKVRYYNLQMIKYEIILSNYAPAYVWWTIIRWSSAEIRCSYSIQNCGTDSQRSQSFVSWFIYRSAKNIFMCFTFKISSNYKMLMIRGSSGLWQKINIWHLQHWAEFEGRESKQIFPLVPECLSFTVWTDVCAEFDTRLFSHSFIKGYIFSDIIWF